jgi:hypothetical protein
MLTNNINNINNINTYQTIKCKLINIVWIERGILLTIIYFILKYYYKLENRVIIVDNIMYCDFLNYIFKNLTFKKFKKHESKNFYFNIRKIIKHQDIIIDYIHNYDEIINTKRLYLVPWYDMNDILVAYKYNKYKYVKIEKYKRFINGFSECRRGLYNNNMIWDMFIEFEIYKKYNRFNSNFKIIDIFNSINNVVISNYTNTVERKYYYIPVVNNIPIYTEPKIINIASIQNIVKDKVEPKEQNEAVTDLLKLMNNKISSLQNI